MHKLIAIILVAISMTGLLGCSKLPSQEVLETIGQQIDVENILTDVLDTIDWEELQHLAGEGYDSLTKKYPALKQENIRMFLKDNGLKLMHTFLGSTEAPVQENARKLGQIITILYPELSDEVATILGS